MSEAVSSQPEPIEFNRKKTMFFQDFTLEHFSRMRLLIKHGRLIKKDHWENVTQHSIVQAAAVEVVSDFLGLDDLTKQALINRAITHDWDKRVTIKPKHFNYPEYMDGLTYSEKVDPQDFKNTTGTDFIVEQFLSLKQSSRIKASLSEMLQYYIDEITLNDDIVPLRQRVAETAKNNSNLNNDPYLLKKLNHDEYQTVYWDAVKEVGSNIEKLIFDVLNSRGAAIDDQTQVPNFIKDLLMEKINQISLTNQSPQAPQEVITDA